MYLVEISKKKACHISYKDLVKKAEKMLQIQNQNNGDSRTVSTRKEVHQSFVIRPRASSKSSKDSLELKGFMKNLLEHVDIFFLKEAYNSIAVHIFFVIIFFTDIWLQNDYLLEKYPES